jgi:hypothetical protein
VTFSPGQELRSLLKRNGVNGKSSGHAKNA